METAEKINPLVWARENLSKPRALAFRKAYHELERGKFSSEYSAEYRKGEEIRTAFIRANLDRTDAIEAEAYKQADELEKQARELMKKAQELRSAAFEKRCEIQSGVYHTEEYKAQQEKISELWRRDDEAFRPKAQALMDKYLKAQEASN